MLLKKVIFVGTICLSKIKWGSEPTAPIVQTNSVIKKMKTKYLKILSLFLLLFVLSFTSCTKEDNDFESIKGDSVAELKNGKPIIRVDKENLLAVFTKNRHIFYL